MNKNIKTPLTKKFFLNLSYLGVLQGFNIILPLVSYPYLIKTLGDETYGMIVFVQSIVGFFVLFVGFGLGLYGSIEVSRNRENKDKLGEILSSIYLIKILLIVISFLVLLILVELSSDYREIRMLFYLSMWMCFYDAFFPGWYFQGIEKMKWITIISVLTRSIFTVSIFYIIEESSDYLLYPLANGVAALISILVSFYVIHKRHKVPLMWVSSSVIILTVKKSSKIFAANIATTASVSLSKVFVGSSFGYADLALYDLGEKILNIFRTPQNILSQVILPRLSESNSVQEALFFRNRLLYFSVILTVFSLLMMEEIVNFLAADQMMSGINLIMLFMLYLPFSSLHGFYGVLFLIPFGDAGDLARVNFKVGILTIAILTILYVSESALVYFILAGLLLEALSVILLHRKAIPIINSSYETE